MIFIAIGFLIWLIATIAFSSMPLFIALMYGVFAWKKVHGSEKFKVALSVALPGMLLDIISILFFPVVFPNMNPDANVLFAGLMLWGYSNILVSGFLPSSEVKYVPQKS